MKHTVFGVFFFNKSRNKRAGALLHNPCGFVTDIYIYIERERGREREGEGGREFASACEARGLITS